MLFRLRFSVLSAAVALSACATVSTPPANSLTVDTLRGLPDQAYVLAPETANIGFAARPLGFPAVQGTFERFDGNVEIIDARGDDIAVRAVVDLASVEIGSSAYENMVKSKAWFHVDEHPNAVFEGAFDRWAADGTGTLLGELTIRGVTQPAELDIQLNCDGIEACPGEAVGFSGTIDLSRSAYGMNAMRGVVRDTVSLTISGVLEAEGPEQFAGLEH